MSFKKLLFAVLILFPIFSLASIPQTPIEAIKALDKQLSDFKTGKNLSKSDKDFNADLKKKILHGTFDINELVKRAMGRHWNNIDEKQRADLVDKTTRLMETRALFAQEQSAAKSKSGGKYQVRYKGERFLDEKKTRARVFTVVIVPSENIDIGINYELRKEGDEWKIYDVILDEASLLENYKYQFNAIIVKHGFNELLSRMEKKLASLEKDRDEVK